MLCFAEKAILSVRATPPGRLRCQVAGEAEEAKGSGGRRVGVVKGRERWGLMSTPNGHSSPQWFNVSKLSLAVALLACSQIPWTRETMLSFGAVKKAGY